MGSYTQYKLDRVEPEERYQEVRDRLSVLAYPTPEGRGPDAGGAAVSPWVDDDRWGNVDPGCKWYRWRQDVATVLGEMPGVKITISYFCEDYQDDWKTETFGDHGG